jgi:hypothetical protein
MSGFSLLSARCDSKARNHRARRSMPNVRGKGRMEARESLQAVLLRALQDGRFGRLGQRGVSSARAARRSGRASRRRSNGTLAASPHQISHASIGAFFRAAEIPVSATRPSYRESSPGRARLATRRRRNRRGSARRFRIRVSRHASRSYRSRPIRAALHPGAWGLP